MRTRCASACFRPFQISRLRLRAWGPARGSRPISRVLSGAAINLRCASPHTCSDLPGRRARATRCSPKAAFSPIWSCSGWGLPRRGVLPPARCALTAPFHPCRRHRMALGRSRLCGTFRGLAPPRRYLAPCPVEPGLSSALARRDCPADSHPKDRRTHAGSQCSAQMTSRQTTRPPASGRTEARRSASVNRAGRARRRGRAPAGRAHCGTRP